ncbi:NAD(P)-dependent oxidoreductase [Oceanicella sp. SM1341]|uniref:NAD(P)-dependent oxidoreductase n=1 Tax=Oceanicella sp. SM1341 TaxID=1548889 RepID=UPI000E500F6C|nr:NAD(P)-dependent oxidoreductase [Oceanicella sp. SM1341]
MNLGFIGLGNMGHAIAANLLKAGYELTVWNRTPERAQALVEAGARRAQTPAEAADVDVVFTMLGDDAAVSAVTFGDDGILAARAKPLHVSMSTISTDLAERLTQAHADAGGRYISAPVFGRPDAAAAAKLFVVTAGAEADLAVCRPLFDAVGQRHFVVGDQPAQANIVKLCGNFLIMSAIEGMAEAMTLAAKNGIDRSALLEVLTSTLFGAPVYHTYGGILAEERFRPAGFAAPLGLKDMRLVGQAAEAARVPLPLLGVVRDHLLSAIAREGEDIDWSGIGAVIAKDAGL